MFEIQSTDLVLLIAGLFTLALLVLGVRIAANTRAVRDGIHQANLALLSDLYFEIAGDPELAALFRRGLNDFANLTPDEKLRMHYLLQATVMTFRGTYDAYRSRQLSTEDYLAGRATILAVLRMPGGKVWWQDGQNAYPHSLREELSPKSDAPYSLADIFPYFTITGNELETAPELANSAANRPAANEERVAERTKGQYDWRRGHARRRIRTNRRAA